MAGKFPKKNVLSVCSSLCNVEWGDSLKSLTKDVALSQLRVGLYVPQPSFCTVMLERASLLWWRIEAHYSKILSRRSWGYRFHSHIAEFINLANSAIPEEMSSIWLKVISLVGSAVCWGFVCSGDYGNSSQLKSELRVIQGGGMNGTSATVPRCQAAETAKANRSSVNRAGHDFRSMVCVWTGALLMPELVQMDYLGMFLPVRMEPAPLLRIQLPHFAAYL